MQKLLEIRTTKTRNVVLVFLKIKINKSKIAYIVSKSSK